MRARAFSSRGAGPDESAPEIAARTAGRPRSAEADRAILDAALACFAESGLDALTIDAVAARAGVGKATIYRRYPGKIALVSAAAQQISLERVPRPDTGSFAGDLRAVLGNLAALFADPVTGPAARMLVVEVQRNTEMAERHRSFIAEQYEGTYGIVDRAIDRGEVAPSSDPLLIGDLAVAPVLHRVLVTGHPIDDAYLDAVVAAVMRAFA